MKNKLLPVPRLLVSLTLLVAAVAVVAAPAVAQASSPHFYKDLVKLEEGEKWPVFGYGQVGILGESSGPTVEGCDVAMEGYVENPVGGGPGKEVIETFALHNCINVECQNAGGRIGMIPEDENAPGLAEKLNWPGELAEPKAGTIKLNIKNISLYVHCQGGFIAPAYKHGEGEWFGFEQRNLAEYNFGVEPTCTTKSPGSASARERSGTSVGKPAETEFFGGEVGKLECGIDKSELHGAVYTDIFNDETFNPSSLQVKKE